MTDEGCVCVLMVLLCIAQARVLTGSDFFCRDPDTGKLHASQTTWPSTTFCGNYTCKLRKKNITATEYAPFRQINVTKINFFSKNLEKQPKTADVTDMNINNNSQEDKYNSNVYIMDPESEDDRYLTEDEIKSITEILHFMKKSDLDTIIEIYKLAQDIYKEIDNTSIEDIDVEAALHQDRDFGDKETVQKIKSVDANAFNVKAQSYWNGPAFTNSRPGDMDTQGTNIITSVPQPKKSDSYFIGPLISTDFRKLPFYYPVSSFQRISSYTHPQPTLAKPCKNKIKQNIQKDIRPSFYLPYPFSYVHNYNYSAPNPNSYYRSNIDKYNLYSRNKLPYIRPYLSQVPNAVSDNAYLKVDRIKNLDPNLTEKGTKEALKPTFKSKKEDIPDWQTSPLTAGMLEEVRAHVQEKTKILKPLRKNIKLERVGKFIKLEELPRQKRDLTYKEKTKRDIELYEVFLDKTTCSSNDTVPGYFRYGNLSHPFPECCPQRISKR